MVVGGLYILYPLIKYAQLSTVSGMAKAVMVGGENLALGATLTATALGADTPGTATIDILPLELSIALLDGANFRGDQSEIVVTVSAGGVWHACPASKPASLIAYRVRRRIVFAAEQMDAEAAYRGLFRVIQLRFNRTDCRETVRKSRLRWILSRIFPIIRINW